MIAQTVRLFIKALVIGVLVNVGLRQIATPLRVDENALPHHPQQLLHPSQAEAELYFSSK